MVGKRHPLAWHVQAAELRPLPSRGPQRPVCVKRGTATDSGPKVFLKKQVAAWSFLSLMPLPSEKSSPVSPRRHFSDAQIATQQREVIGL